MDVCIGVFEVVKFHTKRHRAVIGTVYLGNVDVNAQMVREGMAWVVSVW